MHCYMIFVPVKHNCQRILGQTIQPITYVPTKGKSSKIVIFCNLIKTSKILKQELRGNRIQAEDRQTHDGVYRVAPSTENYQKKNPLKFKNNLKLVFSQSNIYQYKYKFDQIRI